MRDRTVNGLLRLAGLAALLELHPSAVEVRRLCAPCFARSGCGSRTVPARTVAAPTVFASAQRASIGLDGVVVAVASDLT